MRLLRRLLAALGVKELAPISKVEAGASLLAEGLRDETNRPATAAVEFTVRVDVDLPMEF